MRVWWSSKAIHLTTGWATLAIWQQKDLLLPWRTVLDNATLGLELRGMSRQQARQKALDLSQEFGLEGFENQYPFALSGGMRQRAAFLRTMLLDQDVVLLDEPFGALDALTRVQMQEWLLELWDSLGRDDHPDNPRRGGGVAGF